MNGRKICLALALLLAAACSDGAGGSPDAAVRGIDTGEADQVGEPADGPAMDAATAEDAAEFDIQGCDAQIGEADDAKASPVLLLEGGVLIYRRGSESLTLTPTCPTLTIDGVQFSSATAVATGGSSADDVELVCTMAKTQGQLSTVVHYRVDPGDGNLRKWAVIAPSGFAAGAVLQEVVLERFDTRVHGSASIANLQDMSQSFPAFFGNFFAAIEYPIAKTQLQGTDIVLSHKPGRTIVNGEAITTRTAIIGLGPLGQARSSFEAYVDKVRPATAATHATYDNWWSMTNPANGGQELLYNEKQLLELIGKLKIHLTDPYGASFDSLCIDLSWSAKNAIWEIDSARFPDGFSAIKAAADAMHMGLGLWFSPSNQYSPWSFDSKWAKNNGYETSAAADTRYDPSLCTVMGGKYQQQMKASLVNIIKKYSIAQIKVDGFVFTCNETNHGHPTGGYELEYIADGLIDVLQACKQANPNLWIEATCFTPNPSPFWLRYVSSVLGAYGNGDDSPHGLIPAPTYRESVTTARDHFNLQGSDRLGAPVRYQDVLGTIHQTTEDFTNDAVMSALRGNDFLAFYVNPDKDMTSGRWAKIAAVLDWWRKLQSRFHQTRALLPASWADIGDKPLYEKTAMPKEAYGYTHWDNEGGVVGLRNPWIARTSYHLQAPTGSGQWHVVSQYPEERSYGDMSPGGSLEIPLAPYETLVLSLSAKSPASNVPVVAPAGNGTLTSADWVLTSAPSNGDSANTVTGRYTSTAEKTSVLLIFDDQAIITLPSQPAMALDNATILYQIDDPEKKWVQTADPEHAPEYWSIYSANLPAGTHQLSLSFTTPAGAVPGFATAWILTSKPGKPIQSTTALPQPEIIHLDSIRLL